ncbi:hypothetical protein Tco_0151877 [Tanacetum coccineum]
MLYFHNDSLWSRVIKAIYGDDGEVNKVSKYASRSCWRDIINEVRKLKDQGINMRDFMYIKVGNGETTKFWDDIWIGSKPLKLLFPRIYALDNIKDATICMKLNEPSLDNNFRRKALEENRSSLSSRSFRPAHPIDVDLPSEYYKELLYGMFQKHKRLKKYVDHEQLIDVLTMDKSMLEEELRATKSKLKLMVKFGMQMQVANANASCKYECKLQMQMQAANANIINKHHKTKKVAKILTENTLLHLPSSPTVIIVVGMFTPNVLLRITSQVLAFASLSTQFVIGTRLLTMSVLGDALAFEEDDQDALTFEKDDPCALAFEKESLALVFLLPDFENQNSSLLSQPDNGRNSGAQHNDQS